MKYCCDGMIQFLDSGTEKLSINLKEFPNLSGGWVFTLLYRDRKKKNPKQFGWGFKGIRYCPFCGKKLEDKAG